MSDEYGQTLAAFVLDTGKQSRRLLKRLQEIDDVDANVKIVDAAIADRTRFRVKVHQTADLGGAKGTVRGAGLGVIVGAIVLGPAGAVVGGAAGGVLNGLRNRMHDIGINDKFMRQVTKELDKGKSALFILYEGNWAASIGMIEQAITADKALLITSTLPPAKAAALKALVDPAVEQLGGAEVVSDYEVEVPEEAPARGCRAGRGRGGREAAAPAAAPDDLTQLVGVGPKASAALAAAGHHDVRGTGRGQRAAGPACAARGGHGAARQRGDVADAGQLRREGRLAGPHEVQQAELGAQPQRRDQGEGSEGQGRAARRSDPAQRHRAADLLDPVRRWRDHLRRARAHRSVGPAQDHRAERGAATLEPRYLADPGVIRGARRLAGPREL